MSTARLVITAVVVENRSVAEVARTYGVSRSWIYELVARYRTEGDTAFEPRSRRPAIRPRATPDETASGPLAGLRAGIDCVRGVSARKTGGQQQGRGKGMGFRHRVHNSIDVS